MAGPDFVSEFALHSTTLKGMKRVLILGPGGSGKSTLARRLGEMTGLPIIELDKLFWQPGLMAMPRDQWVKTQQQLVEKDGWIMDGDLGPCDAVEVRLRSADTVIFLDFSLARCAWRAVRRGHERADFWLWLWRYHRESRPALMEAIIREAGHTTLYLLRNPQEVRRFLTVAAVGLHQQDRYVRKPVCGPDDFR